MSHYEQRLAEDLQEIRSAIRSISDDIAGALEQAIKATRAKDEDTLSSVILGDLAINRAVRRVDALCHAFVAKHLPAAGHLRFISSVLRLTVALERAGDYAATISRVVLQLENDLSPQMIEKIASLAELSRTMLVDSMNAFLAVDADQARDAKLQGKKIDHLYESIFHELMEEQPRRQAFELASLLTIFGRIERFSDQAKNICEETVFAATGELKAPKVFRMLFVDEKNALASQLAEAIARKSFPKSGVYSSAGWMPAEAVSPALGAVADRFALDVAAARPSKVGELEDYKYHVVVAINPRDSDKVPHPPYHTVLRRWNDIPVVTATEGTELDTQLDALVRELTAHIRSLMEKLRGDQAA